MSRPQQRDRNVGKKRVFAGTLAVKPTRKIDHARHLWQYAKNILDTPDPGGRTSPVTRNAVHNAFHGCSPILPSPIRGAGKDSPRVFLKGQGPLSALFETMPQGIAHVVTQFFDEAPARNEVRAECGRLSGIILANEYVTLT